MTEDELRQQAHVVVTLVKPMPLDVYRDRQADDTLIVDSRASLYLELNDGYPFVVSGPEKADLAGNLQAFLEDEARRQEDHEDGHASADMIRRALSEFDERALILGTVMPLDQYEKREASIREAYDIAAAEVEADTNATPFKHPADQADPAFVQRMRDYYRGGAR